MLQLPAVGPHPSSLRKACEMRDMRRPAPTQGMPKEGSLLRQLRQGPQGVAESRMQHLPAIPRGNPTQASRSPSADETYTRGNSQNTNPGTADRGLDNHEEKS